MLVVAWRARGRSIRAIVTTSVPWRSHAVLFGLDLLMRATCEQMASPCHPRSHGNCRRRHDRHCRDALERHVKEFAATGAMLVVAC